LEPLEHVKMAEEKFEAITQKNEFLAVWVTLLSNAAL